MIELRAEIEQARGNPAALERIYRKALAAGEERTFKEAVTQCADKYSEDTLFSAWAYRLGIRALPESERTLVTSQGKQWGRALALSIVLAILFVLFAGDKPPMPIPGQSNPLFWIGWSPVAALAILFYLGLGDERPERKRWYLASGAGTVALGLLVGVTVWGRTDQVAGLAAIHLPFAVWAAVGAGISLGERQPARDFYAFMVKSVETIVAASIYLAAGVIFVGLTYGIFAALGVKLSEDFLRITAAAGFGLIPVLALNSVYDPQASPSAQGWSQGLGGLLRILTRLFLPLALAVLAVYVFWFIPAYFWRPFREREVLIVYNATIVAIIALLTCAAPGSDEERSLKYDKLLRYGMLSTGILTLLLNTYALVAIVSRTLAGGLTPNRHAVLGWNVVTILMLVVIVAGLGRSKGDKWADVFRNSVAGVMVIAVTWALWVVLGLPHF